ncbi:hypothetical protein [Streptomyces sp. NPDC006132]|uniref:hypothetical protein n=1 Tax=Streptomyces sp. NPDC006132 TaxID=3156732 RepID=UPI0033E7D010
MPEIGIETHRALDAMTLVVASLAEDEQTVRDIRREVAADELLDGMLSVAQHLAHRARTKLVDTLRREPGMPDPVEESAE